MKPFIKWAGGKNLVLGSLQKFFPSKQHSFNYAEPFFGKARGKISELVISNYNIFYKMSNKAWNLIFNTLMQSKYNTQQKVSLLFFKKRQNAFCLWQYHLEDIRNYSLITL